MKPEQLACEICIRTDHRAAVKAAQNRRLVYNQVMVRKKRRRSRDFETCTVQVSWTDMRKSGPRRWHMGKSTLVVRIPISKFSFANVERIAEDRIKGRSPYRMVNVGDTEVISCTASHSGHSRHRR